MHTKAVIVNPAIKHKNSCPPAPFSKTGSELLDVCKPCIYKYLQMTSKKSCDDKHFYECEKCQYKTLLISDYKKHLLTKKHKILTNTYISERKLSERSLLRTDGGKASTMRPRTNSKNLASSPTAFRFHYETRTSF